MSGSGPFQDKPSLRVESLSLSRGQRVLFEGLSFAVDAGGYVEVRGSNGVGKTSLLRAIAGFMKPRAGRLAFAGVEEPATALHFIGHQNGLKGSASARAHVRYWAGLFAVRCDEAAVIESVGLAQQADLPARVLSQGQARRLALSRLLIAERPICLLDEPAAALDADGRATLASLIRRQREKGGVVIAALHEPLDVEPSQTLTLEAA